VIAIALISGAEQMPEILEGFSVIDLALRRSVVD